MIKFIFESMPIILHCKSNEYMRNIFKRLATKVQKSISEIYFLYDGDIVNDDQELSAYLKKDKGKEITILVDEYNNKDKLSLTLSKDIICPSCKEICILNFKDYKICLDNCKNNHFFENILFDEFNEFQKIDESEILCNNHNCENNKKESFNSKFYKCCICKINICPLCKSIHDKTHKLIDYELKNYICNEHGEINTKYCKECNQNLCEKCKPRKLYHISFPLDIILKNKGNNMNELRTKINNLKAEIKEITNKFNKVISNLEAYYDMANKVINNYTENNKNYQILKSINNINDYNKNIINDIDKIIKDNKFKNKVNYLVNIYEKMIINNEITIKYNVNNKKRIKIFDNIFVNNNKENFKIIIKGKECELTSFLDISENEINNGILEIKLRQIKNITNISYMFRGCEELLSIENISNMNTIKVIDMSGLFSKCTTLKSLPDISTWNTSNVKKMNNIFSYCQSLLSVPNISKWNIKNVVDMSRMFMQCNKLSSLPDFSIWNTSKVANMESMFDGCECITIIKGIEKFNTNEVNNMKSMFCFCSKLEELDLSNFNTSKVRDMSNMFAFCLELKRIKGLEKFSTNKVIDISHMFTQCLKLEELDLSNFNTSKVRDMSNIFNNCEKLKRIKGIEKFITIDASMMFKVCKKLERINSSNFYFESN